MIHVTPSATLQRCNTSITQPNEKPTPQIRNPPRRAAKTAATSASDRDERCDPVRGREAVISDCMSWLSAGFLILFSPRVCRPDRRVSLGQLAAQCEINHYGIDNHG
jgi:hypothetical protein